MPRKKMPLTKFYFLAVLAIALVPVLVFIFVSLYSASYSGTDVASAEAVQSIPVDGWAWALSTDSDAAPCLQNSVPPCSPVNAKINSNGSLEFMNVSPSPGNPAGPGWVALINTTSTPRYASPGVTVSSPTSYGLMFTPKATVAAVYGSPRENLAGSVLLATGNVGGGASGGNVGSNVGASVGAGGGSGMRGNNGTSGNNGSGNNNNGEHNGNKSVSAKEGRFDGYIWSSSLGWIQFGDHLSGCPGGDPCDAISDASGRVHGWARIISFPQSGSDGLDPAKDNSGGFKGWIKLGKEAKDPAGPDYGLQISDGALTGYGWSNEFGWIGFAGSLAVGEGSCSLVANPHTTSNTSTVSWQCQNVKTNSCVLTSAFHPYDSNIPQSLGNGLSDTGSQGVTLSASSDYRITCSSINSNTPVFAQDFVTYVPAGSAYCNVSANPASVRVTKTITNATTSLSWGCVHVNNDCALTATATSTQTYSGVGKVMNDPPGRTMLLGKTTLYQISCTSDVPSDHGKTVSADTSVIVKYPSSIIECNPNSPNCQ